MTPSSLELFRKIIRFGIVTRSISRIIFEHLANRPWLCPLSYEDPTCMFGHFCIWDIPFCQVMNITESGSCKLVMLSESESDDQCLREQNIKMFPCVNMHQCHQWRKTCPMHWHWLTMSCAKKWHWTGNVNICTKHISYNLFCGNSISLWPLNNKVKYVKEKMTPSPTYRQ